MTTGSFVAYYRTSTAKQSLGIDAQKDAVARYLNGGDWTLIDAFDEHESGKNDERPALARAINGNFALDRPPPFLLPSSASPSIGLQVQSLSMAGIGEGSPRAIPPVSIEARPYGNRPESDDYRF